MALRAQYGAQISAELAAGLHALDALSDAYSELTQPGAAFALRQREIDGRRVQVFENLPETLGAFFQQTHHPIEQGMFVYDSVEMSYGQLRASVAGFARHLRSRCGIEPGDRVAVSMRNYPEWAVVFWAAQVVGAVLVPLNAWSTRAELEVLIGATAPSLLVADGERLDLLDDWLGVHPDVHVVGVRCARLSGRAVDLGACCAEGSESDLAAASLRPEDPATILFTSGTTGRPKGAVGSHLNHLMALRSLELRAAARDVVAGSTQVDQAPTTGLLTYPLFHISGIAILTSSLLVGRRVALMYRWNAHDAVRLVDELGVQEIYSPPTVTRDLIHVAREQDKLLPSLRTVGGGGAASSAALIGEVREAFGGRVSAATAYGLTETTGAVMNLAGPALAAFPGSVGRPLPGVAVRIIDELGNLAPPGVPGELLVHGALVSSGYVALPEVTAESFKDGWFSTGDLALADDHGLVHLVGRLKDVVIRGGENVYPTEVEEVLEQHPEVVEAAVFGRPDPFMGEEVSARVRVAPGARVTADQLQQHAARTLARFKVPSEVELSTDPLPRTATGKIQKQYLKAPAGGGPSDRRSSS